MAACHTTPRRHQTVTRRFVIVFVLPPSLVFDLFFKARALMVRLCFSAPKLHAQRVRNIQEQIRAWRQRGDGTKLCTARGGWQSISPGYRKYKAHSTQISVRACVV